MLLLGPAEPLAAQLPPEARVELAPLRRQVGWRGPQDDDLVWAVLEAIVDARLKIGRLTAVETPADPERADALAALAKRRHLPLTALGVEAPGVPRALARLRKRKTAAVHALRPAELDGLALTPTPHPTDLRGEAGPFDAIGDLHGCLAELQALLTALGYAPDGDGVWGHAARTAVFLGDLTDRGPDCVATFELVRRMCAAGRARCVLGNHDAKLLRWLEGRKVRVSHGMARTVEEIEALPADEQAAFRARAQAFLAALPSHLQLDGGRLVAAHAGIRAGLIGRLGKVVDAFTCYGDTTGKTDARGLPERRDWAAEYDGEALVVYGHTPTLRPVVRFNTVCVDQGCVFGGGLTALRWPEAELVTVPARHAYHAPWAGFSPLVLPPPQQESEALPLDPV